MTKASHHHPDCPARMLTDDDCRCSWLVRPELPEEQRWLLTPEETRAGWAALATETEPLTPRERAALQAMLAQILAELMSKHKAVKRGEALALFTKVGQREVPDLDGTPLGTVTLEAGASAAWTVTDPDALLDWVNLNDVASIVTETEATYGVSPAYRRALVAAAKAGAEVTSQETGEVFLARDIPGIGMGQPAPPKLVIRPDWDAAVPAVLAALGDAAALLGLEAPELEAAEASDRAELAAGEGS